MSVMSEFLGIGSWPPDIQGLVPEFLVATAHLILPTTLLYWAIFVHLRGSYQTYKMLSFISLLAFLLCPQVVPVQCGPVKCLQHLAIGVGIMKLLDIFARRHSLPTYAASTPPPKAPVLAWIILTELRYESFTPNHIRVPRHSENFSEPKQLAIHAGMFAVLQALPQQYSVIKAYEVLLAIYIIWTCGQLLLRYKTSPALFGPVYLADSLTGFWSESWHNAFASPCESLAYKPARTILPRYGVPVVVARSIGVMGAFALMAIFHIFALQPILPRRSLSRIGLFFFINGVATMSEAAIWGRRKHWLKTVLAWTFETCLAAWTAETAHIPEGLNQVYWTEFC